MSIIAQLPLIIRGFTATVAFGIPITQIILRLTGAEGKKLAYACNSILLRVSMVASVFLIVFRTNLASLGMISLICQVIYYNQLIKEPRPLPPLPQIQPQLLPQQPQPIPTPKPLFSEEDIPDASSSTFAAPLIANVPAPAIDLNLQAQSFNLIKGTIYILDKRTAYIDADFGLCFRKRLKYQDKSPYVQQIDDAYLPIDGDFPYGKGTLDQDINGKKTDCIYLPSSLFKKVKEGGTVRFFYDDQVVILTCMQSPNHKEKFPEHLASFKPNGFFSSQYTLSPSEAWKGNPFFAENISKYNKTSRLYLISSLTEHPQNPTVSGIISILPLRQGRRIDNDQEFAFSRRCCYEDGSPLIIGSEEFYVPFAGIFDRRGALGFRADGLITSSEYDPDNGMMLPSSLFVGKKNGDTIRFYFDDDLIELTCDQSYAPQLFSNYWGGGEAGYYRRFEIAFDNICNDFTPSGFIDDHKEGAVFPSLCEGEGHRLLISSNGTSIEKSPILNFDFYKEDQQNSIYQPLNYSIGDKLIGPDYYETQNIDESFWIYEFDTGYCRLEDIHFIEVQNSSHSYLWIIVPNGNYIFQQYDNGLNPPYQGGRYFTMRLLSNREYFFNCNERGRLQIRISKTPKATPVC